MTESSVNIDPIQEEDLDFERAIVVIKRMARGRTVFLGVSQFATAKDQTGVTSEHIRGRIVYSHVRLSAKEVVKYLLDAYSINSREKYSVRIAYSQHCLFVGKGC